MKKIDTLFIFDVSNTENIKEISCTTNVTNKTENNDTLIEEEEDHFEILLNKFIEEVQKGCLEEGTNIEDDTDREEQEKDNMEEKDDNEEDTNDDEEEDLEEDMEPSNKDGDDEEEGNNSSSHSKVTFDQLIGLRSVKNKLVAFEKMVRFNKLRNDHGLPTPFQSLHAMFLESPGTGKTTVAMMMGKMLHKIGVLSSGHVVIKERSSLMGQNYGSEEANTREAIAEAQGGILFIDEAYQLYQPNDPRDPGKFVIETLMTVLANDSLRDWMLILAGYPEDMLRMFEMTPGFKSRIPETNIYTFDDFTEEELMEIADRYIERNKYTFTPEAREALSLRLASDYKHRDKSFGNARHVVNLIETSILPAMAMRVMETENVNERMLTEIHACVIPKPSKLIKVCQKRIGFCA